MNQIETIYKRFIESQQICTDTRDIKPNSIFFALKGENFDGNNFVEKALASGCNACVCSDPKYLNYDDVFVVNDSLKTLQDLANHHRKILNIPIIAITGTNGKTTTKEILARVLDQKFRVAYTQGNLNNHIGVPLTLLAMNKDIEIGIVEMGANHIGEISLLCKIAEPNYGIITNNGKAHLEGFGGFEGGKQAKNELFEYIIQNNGTIFSNTDNEILNKLLNNKKSISYGKTNNPFCHGEIIKNTSNDFTNTIKWKCRSENGLAVSNLFGEYNFENILCAITIGNYFNIPAEKIDSAINSYFPQNNRSQLVKDEKNTLILDYYNANPTSMASAIDNFKKLDENNKCLILGDMLELGDESKIEHKKILDSVNNGEFKDIYLVGKYFYSFKNEYNFMFFNSYEEIIKYLSEHTQTNKFFLIKGSRGIKLEHCVKYLTQSND